MMKQNKLIKKKSIQYLVITRAVKWLITINRKQVFFNT